MTRPLAVAITGGIGAGKSEALAAFRRHGAATVSSDEIVHELLQHEDVKRAVVERLGNGVVGPRRRARPRRDRHGRLQRPRGARVARRPPAPARLGRVPPLARSAGSVCRARRVSASPRCRSSTRRAPTRSSTRSWWSPLRASYGRRARYAAVDDREQRLLDDKEKVARADYAYTNTGTLEELDAFVASVMTELCS